ncbi:MAG: glycosyltransferase family 9 protein [Nitrospirota bacterium]
MNQGSEQRAEQDYPWINPIGGFGDMLMLSGVLKLVLEHEPARRFNLIRRTNYLSILKGHPAIAGVGYPPKGAEIIGVDYWSREKLGSDNQRAFQVLARIFGLSTPVDERLYIPELPGGNGASLEDLIPWGNRNILIAPFSDSPRKVMHPAIWNRVVEHLYAQGMTIFQAGRLQEKHIRNAYSLRGLTTPRQLIALLGRFDAVITSDNFIMHAAHLAGARCVALWGPTQHEVYGYAGQFHIQMKPRCDETEGCISSRKNQGGTLYNSACPLGERHCMDQIRPEAAFDALKTALLKK